MDAIELNVFPCSLCHKELNIPRLFPCQHTFCDKCIRSLIERTNYTEHLRLDCPVCFDEFSAPSKNLSLQDLVQLFPINNLLENLICSTNGNKTRKSCDPCRLVNEENQADHHCRTCRQSLCERCYKYMHQRLPGQASHKVTPLKEFFESGCIEVNEPCPVHPKKWLEVYCCDHEMPCCTLCTSSNHKNCFQVQTLDQAFETKAQDANMTVLKTLLDNIRKKTNAAIGIVYEKENMGTFRDLEEKVSAFVLKFRETIDTLHRNFEKEQKYLEVSDRTTLYCNKRQLAGFLHLLNDTLQIIERAEQVGSKRQVFLATMKMKQLLILSFQKIQKFSEQKVDHILAVNPKVQEFENIESVAEVQVKAVDSVLTSDISQQLQLFTRYIDVGLEDITNRSSVTVSKKLATFTRKPEEDSEFVFFAGVVLSSGRIFAIDDERCRLVEVNRNSEFTNLYEFDGGLRAICVDPMEEKLAISSGTELQEFSIYPTFKLNRVIETGLYFECVHFLNENFICSDGRRIFVINSAGKVERQLDGPHNDPGSFALSHDRKRVYYVKTNTIVCHEIDGNIVFQREIDFSETVQGMALDDHGNLYVCDGRKDGSIIQISSDGENIRTLMQFESTEKESDQKESESNQNESDSDNGSREIVRTISFDKTGKKFLICSKSDTVELFEIN